MLDLLPGLDFSHSLLPEIRKQSEAQYALLGEPPLPPVIKTIAGPDGPLDVYWFDPGPGRSGRPALLHINGGGMVIGSARSMPHSPSGLASALGMPVASVEYRLAPEAPFPAPQEDCLAALAWLSGQAEELGVDAERIGIIGESAGGGLAAGVAQMARDTGGPKLAAQVLIYPMLDHRTGSDACPYRNPTTGEFVWTRASNRFGWQALQGSYSADDARRGWFSPILAGDLAGLPSTWIGTGSLDLFFDENLAYARSLVSAGVSVEVHSYPGAVHGFNMIASAQIAQAFQRDLLTAIPKLLAKGALS